MHARMPRSSFIAARKSACYRPANLVALEALLAPLGRPLVKAGSGEEALRFLLHEECALILLDVQMPDLDG